MSCTTVDVDDGAKSQVIVELIRPSFGSTIVAVAAFDDPPEFVAL
jgi:hypothetical protein